LVWGQLGAGVASTGQAAGAAEASISEEETLRQAGHLMRELGVGTLGVRRGDGECHGVISRDMVVGTIAAGGDPKTVTVGEVVSRRLARTRTRAIFPRRLYAAVS
jgi:CBS domain-containing protein